jgi:PAS domain S-box-containing protein
MQRTRVIVAAGAILVALVGYLLFANYRAALTLRQNLLTRHSQEVQLHAAALSHVLATAKQDLRYVAESREVAAFFENRDLGMSMQYGLALSLVPIRDRLESLVKNPEGDGAGPTFLRIIFLDSREARLADTGAKDVAGPMEPPDPRGRVAVVKPSQDARHLLVTRSHWFKGQYAGRFVGWLNAAAVRAAIAGGVAGTANGPFLRLYDDVGRSYRLDDHGEASAELEARWAEIPADGRVVELKASANRRDALLAVRVPVPQQQLTLVAVSRASDLVGDLSPTAGARNLTIVAVAVLAMVLVAIVLNSRSLVLQMRLDESLRREREVAEKHAALEREMAERQRLQAAHALLAMAVDQAAEAIAVTDVAGNVAYVNPAYERLSGFLAAEIRGRPARELYDTHNAADVVSGVSDALARHRPWKGELAARRRDGSPVDMEVMISPVHDASGTVVNHVVVARDVTEEKQLREQLRHSQKLEAIGTLAGGVAHDFNNLLTAMKGYTELARDALEPGNPVREDIQEIERAVTRATDLTRQLLAFSRKQVLKPQILDLNKVVGTVEKMLRRLIGENIDLVTVPALGLRRVRVDPGQLEQILVNLAVNARDAMPNGGRLLITTANATLDEADARRHADGTPGSFVHLSVSDTGTGMDAATRARVFEPFFTTKGRGKGTGLGLATVYGIVRQSRGFISVTSEPDRGTTFDVFLPAEAVEEVAVTSSSAPVERHVPAGAGETILVVEDEPQVRALLQAQLSAAGYAVVPAADGREALEVARRHPQSFDVLLSDVVMPHLSGPDLAQVFCEQYPDTVIVFMSGYSEEAVERQGEIGKAAAFIHKPYDVNDLCATLRRLLASRGPRDSFRQQHGTRAAAAAGPSCSPS